MIINDTLGDMITTSFTSTTTPQILASVACIERSRTGRIAVVVSNTGSGTVYVGGSTVTTDNGLPIKAGEHLVFSCNENSAKNIYIVGAGTVILAECFA
jgi:hypothetical protein